MIADCFCITAEIEGEQITRYKTVTNKLKITCSTRDWFLSFPSHAADFIFSMEKWDEKKNCEVVSWTGDIGWDLSLPHCLVYDAFLLKWKKWHFGVESPEVDQSINSFTIWTKLKMSQFALFHRPIHLLHRLQSKYMLHLTLVTGDWLQTALKRLRHDFIIKQLDFCRNISDCNERNKCVCSYIHCVYFVL